MPIHKEHWISLTCISGHKCGKEKWKAVQLVQYKVLLNYGNNWRQSAEELVRAASWRNCYHVHIAIMRQERQKISVYLITYFTHIIFVVFPITNWKDQRKK